MTTSPPDGLWVERLTLTAFRNHAALTLETGPGPVVLTGPNGAGKTNILEAVSLLAAGNGLRRAVFSDLASSTGDGGWAVAARVHSMNGAVDIGTGIRDPAALGAAANAQGSDRIQAPSTTARPTSARIVRINGETQSGSGILADLVEMVWLTPAMDGLFTGPAGERRRFLDRLILCFDPAYRTIAGRFERAMQSRNRLLAEGVRDAAQLGGYEAIMAQTGVAIAAVRAEAASSMAGIIARRRERDPDNPFPWAEIAIEGALEADLAAHAAVDVEDRYMNTLSSSRARDRAAGRTLDGPHRSDLVVRHGPKATAARLCSTGEQKALLLGLVLAHAELVAARQEGIAPILLLDEITAHLDEHRRAAMFDEIVRLNAQAWMTGTDASAFSALENRARYFKVGAGTMTTE